jgi:SAM-dependent methyltransferase
VSNSKRYRQYFEAFLRSTDEKSLLLEKLLGYVEKFNPRSIFEIGPGPGDISRALANTVEAYSAVEMNQEYAQALQSESLNVINGTFPNTDVEGKFDLVLAIHVITYDDNTEKMISRAGEHLNDGGHMVLVTYRELDSDWTRLMKSAGYEQISSIHAYTFEEMEELITNLSHTPPQISTIQTHVHTSSPTEMINALSFVASNGDAKRAEEFRARSSTIIPLLEEYKSKNGYSFPFTHHFLIVQKTNTPQ